MVTGTYLARWDGTNDRGLRVESGTYLIELRMGDLTETRKAVVLE